jgi:hypothetical protein
VRSLGTTEAKAAYWKKTDVEERRDEEQKRLETSVVHPVNDVH